MLHHFKMVVPFLFLVLFGFVSTASDQNLPYCHEGWKQIMLDGKLAYRNDCANQFMTVEQFRSRFMPSELTPQGPSIAAAQFAADVTYSNKEVWTGTRTQVQVPLVAASTSKPVCVSCQQGPNVMKPAASTVALVNTSAITQTGTGLNEWEFVLLDGKKSYRKESAAGQVFITAEQFDELTNPRKPRPPEVVDEVAGAIVRTPVELRSQPSFGDFSAEPRIAVSLGLDYELFPQPVFNVEIIENPPAPVKQQTVDQNVKPTGPEKPIGYTPSANKTTVSVAGLLQRIDTQITGVKYVILSGSVVSHYIVDSTEVDISSMSGKMISLSCDLLGQTEHGTPVVQSRSVATSN